MWCRRDKVERIKENATRQTESIYRVRVSRGALKGTLAVNGTKLKGGHHEGHCFLSENKKGATVGQT